MAEAAQASAFNLDSLAVFAASVAQDAERIDAMARNVGADCAALQALAALVPVPFLHACARRWGAVPAARWTHPYCPVCGAWGAFREDRGGEGGREERCARCGSAWAGRFLSCPYCDTSDHEALVSLLPGNAPSQGAIVACQRCRGYVKTFTTLQPCPGPDVMLKDLASVDLDVAAITHGYRRPSKPGYRPAVTVRVQES
jgi:FdhE protein